MLEEIKMNQLNEKLSQLKVNRILDVATRDGAFIKRLIDYLPGYEEIIGIDINEKALAKAQGSFEGEPAIQFELMDGYQTRFSDQTFDLVTFSNSMHHVSDIPSILKEMKRVKKTDGLILISEMPSDGQSGPSLTHALIHHLDTLVDTHLNLYHHPCFTHEEISKFVVDAGLEILDAFDDLELDNVKNGAISDRAKKALNKVKEHSNAANYEEMLQIAQKIEENNGQYGANTAIQYILFAK